MFVTNKVLTINEINNVEGSNKLIEKSKKL